MALNRSRRQFHLGLPRDPAGELGGATWTPVGPSGIAGWAYLGFTDATHGVGLGYLGALAAGNERLYYTTDAGQSYHLVSLT